ncbi:sugar transferase [Fredinandcohnia salidurans]|uniref:Sugar transferase n=1 Tax=Fredinandcohnia salidurans TaxID=2595041 RepID=A0ABW4MSR9_9BACI
MFYRKYIKRLVDISLSLFALIVLFPLFVVITIAIKIDSKGPVFFRQKRVGKDKKDFQIYKFRTMHLDAPKDMPTFMLENPDIYITKLGKFLRKSSLDELPQILNILKGDMSIIGPRPVIRKEVELYKEREIRGVYNIKPGLTGLAQVNGRDVIALVEKARLDGYYADHISFLLDLKIFITTLIYVIKLKGVREGAPLPIEKEKTKTI